MRRLWHYLRHRPRRGSALLLTLAVMSLFLIMAMVFAFDAQTTTTAAGHYAAIRRARLINDTALNRFIGFLNRELYQAEPMNPGRVFFGNGTAEWSGRFCMPTLDFDTAHRMTADRDTALAANLSCGSDTVVAFTPANAAALSADVAWMKVMALNDTSDSGTAATLTDSIIGAFAFVAVDCTGLVDPTVVLGATPEGGETRVGEKMDELNLCTLAQPPLPALEAARFAPPTPPGAWLGYDHLLRSLGSTHGRIICDSMFPFSVGDPEEFWFDIKSDTKIDTDTEIYSRYDLSSLAVTGVPATDAMTITNLYNFLLCSHVDPAQSANPSRALNAKASPWITSLTTAPSTLPATLAADPLNDARRAALQLAVLMWDSVDTDAQDGNNPTYATLDGNTGNITVSTNAPPVWPAPAIDNKVVVYGIEPAYGLAELFVRLTGVPTGRNLVVTPEFQVKWHNPLVAKGAGSASLQIYYEYSISSTSSGSPSSDSATFPLSLPGGPPYKSGPFLAINSSVSDADLDGAGIWGSGLDPGGATTIVNAFGPTVPPYTDQDTWQVDWFRVRCMIVTSDGRIVRQYPINDPDKFGYWTNTLYYKASAAGTQAYSLTIRAQDPLFADRDKDAPDFATFWTDLGLQQAVGAPSALKDNITSYFANGGPYNHSYYQGAGAGDYQINSAFKRVGHLGRLHSPIYPNRSVRLWAGTAGVPDTANHDAYLLDMFKIGAASAVKGRINLNTHNAGVAQMLFAYGPSASGLGADTTAVAQNASTALRNANGSWSFKYRGDIYRMFYQAPLALNTTTDEDDVEDLITKTIELTTTRQNYFAVVATAQALKDHGAMAVAGAVVYDPSGPKYATVEAEYKTLALIYRDAWRNRASIIRIDEVEE